MITDTTVPMRPAATRRGSRRPGRTVVALAAAAALVAACGNSSSSPKTDTSSAKVHLTMWQQWGGGHEQQTLDHWIKVYEGLHPNVSITETPVTNDAKILTSITGGNPPDVVDLGTGLPLGGWAAQGAVQPLDGLIKSQKVDLSVFNPTALEGDTVNGKLYALPFQLFDIALLYNKKLFAAAGLAPPTTLEQLDADAVKLTKTDGAGAITQLGFVPDYPGPDQGQTCPLESYGWLFGGSWNDASGKPTPLVAANVKALAWEQSLYKTFGPQKVSNFIHSAGAYLTSGDPFESGKLAMMFDGPWSEQYAIANNPALAKDVGVVKFPAPTGLTQNSGTTFLDSDPQLIPVGAKNTAAAFQFIAWMTTNAKETAEFSDAVANIPQLKTVPAYSLQKDPLFQLYVDEANSPQAHVWHQAADSTTYGTLLCQAQESALLQGKDPKQALQVVSSSLGTQ